MIKGRIFHPYTLRFYDAAGPDGAVTDKSLETPFSFGFQVD